MTTTTNISLFQNEPFTNFSNEENKKDIQDALKTVKAELGKHYPLSIGAEKINVGQTDCFH